MKHTLRRCLSLVLALATLLTVCVVPLTAATPDCNHYDYEDSWTYIGFQEATCDEYGGNAYLCGHCNTRFIDHRTWDEPLNHKNADGSSALRELERQEPTHLVPGWVKYVCNLCGENVTHPLSATKCDTACDYEYTSTATCTEAGVKTGVCKVCGHTTTEDVPALGHDWDDGEIVVAPVCGTADDPATPEDETVAPINAKVLFTCDRCDATETKEEIAPVNHKWFWKEDSNAGCSVTPGYICEYCDAQHPTEPYSFTQHNYVDYNDPADADHQNVAPTCEDGLKWQKCSNCGDFESVVLKADEYGYHTHPTDALTRPGVTSMLTKISVHTCGNPGFMKCSECGRDDIADKYDPAAHNYITVDPTCVDYGYKSCVICGHTVGYLYIDANGNQIINEEFDKLGHLLPTDPTQIENHEADCDERGWRKYICQRAGCTGYDHMNVGSAQRNDGYVYEYTTTAALGHNWKAIPLVPAQCGVTGTSAHTECQRCFATQNKVTLPALSHDWKTASIPANCLYPAHIGQICKNCGIENMDPSVMSNWSGEKDETAHKWDESQTVMVTEATCTTPGLIRKYCTICNKPHEVTVKETGHTLVKIGVVPATCQSEGYEVFYCTVCTAFAKGAAITDVPLNMLDQYDSHAKYTGDLNSDFTYDAVNDVFELTPVSHTWSTSTHVKFVGNDVNDTTINPLLFCGVYSYEERECSECGVTYHKRLADAASNLLTGEHHPVSADQPATCTQPGYVGRTVCQRCNTVITAGEIIPAKHVFDKTAADYQGFQAPDCFNGGWEEKGTCTVCLQSNVMNGVTAPLDHKVEGEFSLELIEQRAADCVLFGYDAHYACTLCGAKLLNSKVVIVDDELDTTNVTLADFVTDLSVNGDNGYVAPLNHLWTGAVHFVPFACCEDGYAWKICERDGCSEIQIEAYTFGYANHRYSDKTYSTDRKPCQDSYNLCQNHVQKDCNGVVVASYTATLILCGHKDPLSTAADPHINADNQVIDLSDCKNWKADQDHKCVTCDETFTIADVDHHGEAVSAHIDATCISYAYDLWSCTRCKNVWTKNVVPTYGAHNMVASTDSKLPTWTALGLTKTACSLCGETGTSTVTKAADIFFKMTDPASKFGGNYIVNGGYIAVTVKMVAADTLFHSVNLSVKFDPAVLEFAGVASESVQIGDKTLAITAYCDNNGMNTVEIFANVENAEGGKLQNASIKGAEVELVTLYFQVNPDFYEEGDVCQVSAIDFGTASVVKVDGNNLVELTDLKYDTMTYGFNPTGAKTKGMAYAFNVYKLGDLNGGNHVTDVDAVLVEKLVVDPAAAYDARADINKDGVVNTADFIAIKQYVVKMMNYPELAALVLPVAG